MAAVGFGLAAYPIGAERGWVTREEARESVLTTLRFLRNAPSGEAAAGVTGTRGFFYHFLDMETGQRFETIELSTVDTALCLAGALFCQSYFDGQNPAEAEVRAVADELFRRADWAWAATPRPPRISMGWTPEKGFHTYDWKGYNEAMIVYVLALGSPTHPVGEEAWPAYTSTYRWETFQGQTFVNFAPLFGHQYSHVFLDLEGIRDAYMREKGIDYFENSRRATLAQRAYAIANPGGFARLRGGRVGPHGVRRPRGRDAGRERAPRALLQLRGARRRGGRRARRRHARAGGGSGLAAVHAGAVREGAPDDGGALGRRPLRPLRLPRRVQPHVHVLRGAQARPRRGAERAGST